MKFKDAYFNIFDYFKTNLNANLTSPLNDYRRGFPPNNNDTFSKTLFMIGYSGSIGEDALADPEKKIDLSCFILLTNSNQMESDVFTLLDDITEFVNKHPTMAGVDLVEITDWEIDFAENETTAAALHFRMSVQFH